MERQFTLPLYLYPLQMRTVSYVKRVLGGGAV
jgi:hypothetical protein